MLKKLIVSIILGFSCLFSSIGYCQSDTIKDWEIQSNDIKEVNISVTLRPIKDSAYLFLSSKIGACEKKSVNIEPSVVE